MQIHADARGCFNLLVPGSEIPEWFSHQTDETSIQIPENSFPWFEESGISIKIPLPPIIGNDSPWVGVAICSVFDFAPHDYDLCTFNKHLYFSNNPIKGKDGLKRFKDHLWLCYWTRNELYNSKLNGEHVCDEILECRTTDVCGIKVKKCGLQLVYEKDLEENGGALVRRKRNIYEESGPSESDSAEERPQPNR